MRLQYLASADTLEVLRLDCLEPLGFQDGHKTKAISGLKIVGNAFIEDPQSSIQPATILDDK